jgi:hypothetical protein
MHAASVDECILFLFLMPQRAELSRFRQDLRKALEKEMAAMMVDLSRNPDRVRNARIPSNRVRVM